MIIESELREEMARAVEASSSSALTDLYRWLMARSWNMHRDSTAAAVDLAAEVESIFFEPDLSDDERRREFAELLTEPALSTAPEPQ